MAESSQNSSVRIKDHEILRVYLPELPIVSARPDSLLLSDRVFFENVGESFTELQKDGSTRHRAIEAVTMSLDGLTYRITLRKGMKFHCGSEITADDAVACILRVLKNKNSASQLHRFVALNRPGSLELPVQAVSRYRIEVHLNQRLSDFLQRLSLSEFILQHDGRSCFSGLWKISGSDESGISLSPHLDHPDIGQPEYKLVRIEKIDPEDVGHLNFSDVPFAFAYEGTFCKSPSQEVLQDESVRDTSSGTSFFFRCEKPESLTTETRKVLVSGAKRFFSENSLWRRLPLTSGVPDGHLAHIPFATEGTSDGKVKEETINISLNESALPQRVLDSFKRFMKSETGIDIRFLDSVDENTDDITGKLKIEKMVSVHPADIYSPLCQEVRHPKLLKNSVFSDLEMKRKGPLVTYLQNLTRDGYYLPFVFVPWVVRSNRPMKTGEDGKVLNFSLIGQSEQRSRRRKVQEKSLVAIGNAVQMFVHDVKRPFSLVQGILSLLESTDDSQRMKEIVQKYVPDVKRTIKSVDGLIQDILEIGSDAEPSCDDVSFKKLLVDVLADIFRFEGDADINFAFDFQHTHFLFVDSHKINRVIQNLVANAMVAMKRKGDLWFHTRDAGAGFVQVCVGNSNSYIPPGKITGLFDRFYTEGNKKGTGLGLAISHKIVTDHGGKIWCESDRDSGTKFYFTVPASTSPVHPVGIMLPASARDIVLNQKVDDVKNRPMTIDPNGLSVLMLDDDKLYLEVTRELLTLDEQKQLKISFKTANDFKTAMLLFTGERFDIVIADVDLGSKNETGLDFVREIRKSNQKVRICVHSNGSPFELQRRVLEAGGDLFLPKPMTREHLISLLESTSRDLSKVSRSLNIAVVDDDALMLEMWESVGRYKIHSFFSPEEFFLKCPAGSELFKSLSCVISDFTFPDSDYDGLEFVQACRRHGFVRPMVLMTDRPISNEQCREFDILPKDIQKGLEYLSRVLSIEY